MNTIYSSSMISEVVSHTIECLIIAIEHYSLEAVRRCAETVIEAIVSVYNKNLYNKEIHKISIILIIKDWLNVLISLISKALTKVITFTQRLHASPIFGVFESEVSKSLVNLIFCTVTLCRCVGIDFKILQLQKNKGKEKEEIESKDDILISNNDKEEVLQIYSQLCRELCIILSSNFSFLVYNAEQQYWQLENIIEDKINKNNFPILHKVPEKVSYLSEYDGWIWLLIEATTSGMIITSLSNLSNENLTEIGVTQAILTMNPSDIFDAPFSQKLINILINIFIFFLKQWMKQISGFSEILYRWKKIDNIPSSLVNYYSKDVQYEEGVKKSKNDISIPSEICIIIYDIIDKVPEVFMNTSLLLKLLRLLSQLSIIRVFFATQTSFILTGDSQNLAINLSKLLEKVSENVFVFSNHILCNLLPYEAAIPYLQLTLFNMISYAIEFTREEKKINLLTEICPTSALSKIYFAYNIWCYGIDSISSLESKSKKQKKIASTLEINEKSNASFAQAFVLAIEEVFAFIIASKFPSKNSSPLCHFFCAIQRVLHGATQEWESTISSSSYFKRQQNHFPCVFSGETLTVIEDILSVYIHSVKPNLQISKVNETLPMHRCYWLLSVSYLRMADFEARVSQKFEAPLNSLSGDCNGFWYCKPSDSLHWLHLNEKNSLSFSYEEWVKIRSHRQQNLKKNSNTMSNCLSKLRDRLVSASLRFFLLALRETIIFEELEKQKRKGKSLDNCSINPVKEGEISQSTAYLTAFTRFLLLMEHVPASEVVRYVELGSETISKCKSIFSSTKKNSLNNITEDDINSARAYQLAVSLFVL